MTPYGAVSGRSQSLFTPISKGPDEDETEEFEDDESEDEEEGLEAYLWNDYYILAKGTSTVKITEEELMKL